MQVQAGCAHFSVPAISHLLERFCSCATAAFRSPETAPEGTAALANANSSSARAHITHVWSRRRELCRVLARTDEFCRGGSRHAHDAERTHDSFDPRHHCVMPLIHTRSALRLASIMHRPR